jgi:hypothetical protein
MNRSTANSRKCIWAVSAILCRLKYFHEFTIESTEWYSNGCKAMQELSNDVRCIFLLNRIMQIIHAPRNVIVKTVVTPSDTRSAVASLLSQKETQDRTTNRMHGPLNDICLKKWQSNLIDSRC